MTTREDFEVAPPARPDRAVLLTVGVFLICTLLGSAAAGFIGAATDGSAIYWTIQAEGDQDSSFNWFFQFLGVLAGVIAGSIMYAGITIAEQIRIHRIPPQPPAPAAATEVQGVE